MCVQDPLLVLFLRADRIRWVLGSSAPLSPEGPDTRFLSGGLSKGSSVEALVVPVGARGDGVRITHQVRSLATAKRIGVVTANCDPQGQSTFKSGHSAELPSSNNSIQSRVDVRPKALSLPK